LHRLLDACAVVHAHNVKLKEEVERSRRAESAIELRRRLGFGKPCDPISFNTWSEHVEEAIDELLCRADDAQRWDAVRPQAPFNTLADCAYTIVWLFDGIAKLSWSETCLEAASLLRDGDLLGLHWIRP
jgi:hypothetical protein